MPPADLLLVESDASETLVSATPGDVLLVEPVSVLSGGGGGGSGGSTGESVKIAGTNLSGHRVVTTQADGSVVYASNDDLTAATKQFWMTTGAVLAGDSVTLLSYGDAVEPSWSWTPGQSIFLGTNGVMTQTPPTFAAGAKFIVQVASAEDTIEIFFDPRDPIALG